VTFKLDARNSRSFRAVERLGAQYDGTLRHHRLRADGTVRDSAYFSVLAAEWPGVRARLEARLA
jgi:RimJ/RimL family protein N-acetyltransferase